MSIITDEMVEVAARAAYERHHKGLRNVWGWEDHGLDDEHPGTRKRFLTAARAALAAVAPLIAEAERGRCLAVARRWTRDGQSATAHGIILGIEELRRHPRALDGGHHAMSDTQRCEPPEHLRDRNGWHRVALPTGGEDFARWVAEPQAWEAMPRTELWFTTASEAGIFGYRYLAPVTPPSTVAALVEALEGLVMACELPGDHCEREQALPAATAALALYRGEVA